MRCVSVFGTAVAPNAHGSESPVPRNSETDSLPIRSVRIESQLLESQFDSKSIYGLPNLG
jgi:hypothetical protein